MEQANKFVFDLLSGLVGVAFGFVVGFVAVLVWFSHRRGASVFDNVKLFSILLGTIGYLGLSLVFGVSFGGGEFPWLKTVLRFLVPFGLGFAGSCLLIAGIGIFYSRKPTVSRANEDHWFDLPRLR